MAMASRGALKTRHHDSGYASLEEMRQALAAEGLPIDHLEEPKLIEHGCTLYAEPSAKTKQ